MDWKWLRYEGAISEDLCSTMLRYALLLEAQGKGDYHDIQAPGSPSFYSDPFMESLLQVLQASIEERIKLELFPTYSYMRIYRTGAELEIHKDRPACEISVSLCVGADAEWPLFIDGTPVLLKPRDAVIYRGLDIPHWRERFKGTIQVQVFLHYVSANGPYRDERFDRRVKLGDPR